MKINYIILLLFTILLAGCTVQETPEISEEEIAQIKEDSIKTAIEVQDPKLEDELEVIEDSEVKASGWRDFTFFDVNSGNSFKISDFKGTPVLLESFAVWCPTCTQQQKQLRALHEELGDSFISVSLDTDPNEIQQQVIDHTQRYGFNWRYAISPAEATRSLIDEFGINIVNAPLAPVVLICEDQSARLLPRGVKDTEELKEEMAKGC